MKNKILKSKYGHDLESRNEMRRDYDQIIELLLNQNKGIIDNIVSNNELISLNSCIDGCDGNETLVLRIIASDYSEKSLISYLIKNEIEYTNCSSDHERNNNVIFFCIFFRRR